MSTPRRSTRTFTAKRNSEPGSQSGAWDSGLPPQYMPPDPSIQHHHHHQHHHQQQPRTRPPPWLEPRPWRRPTLISAPLGDAALIPQLALIVLILLALIAKLASHFWGVPFNSITPAPRDFGWIEYIPHARTSRFRGASSAQIGGGGGGGGDGGSSEDDDIAFALGNAQHGDFATAAWRIFSAADANANWTDPRKTQPTAAESLACRARVGAEHARLADVWNPVRADYAKNANDRHETRLLKHLTPLLGGLSREQLRVVDGVLRVAYRDALFLCMTLRQKRRWLAILEGNEVPDSAFFFPVVADDGGGGAPDERKDDSVLGHYDAQIGGQGGGGRVDGHDVAVSGARDGADDADNATVQR